MLPFRFIIIFVLFSSGCASTPAPMIITAAEQGQVETLETLLSEGASIETQGYRYRTPLHMALWKDKADAAKLLIERGANINARDEADWTPLHFAARFSTTLELTDLLIKKGADVNAKANKDNNNTPLDLAAYQEYGDEIALLLMEKGATGEIKTKGKYPTRLAAAKSVLNRAKDENDMDVLIRLKNLYPSTPIAALVTNEVKLRLESLNTRHEKTAELKKQQKILRKKMGVDINSVVYVTNTGNSFIATAIGSLQLALDGSGFNWSTSLVGPTVWVFGSVPPNYTKLVKKGGAYFREANNWKFITKVDTELPMEEAAALFGINKNSNSTLFSLE